MKRKSYSGPYRVDPQPSLDFEGELIVDLFAGGGGASTGMEWALGRSPDIAVNHDPEAVALHQVNHPHTLHLCESVFDVVPQEICAGRPVGHLWMSPDCKHFSKAKGRKPVSKRIRGLAWVGKRWAATVRPRVIFLENVEEFITWGPLVRVNGEWHPCKKRSGRTFRNFVRELKRLGYDVDWRELRACDYGAPTIRKRLFLVARCDGEPISWPEPTHADPKTPAVAAGCLFPWRTAAECIDWSIPCPSIFERKRPLAENTLRRIARGIQRYVIDAPEPFIVPIAHYNGSTPAHSIRQPLRTITAHPKGGAFAVVAPSISPHTVQAAMILKHYGGVVGHSVNQPVGAITTQDHHGIAAATLIQTGYGERPGQAPRVPHLDKPLGTAVAGGVKHAVAAARMQLHPRLHSHAAESRAFLLKYYGADQDPRMEEPLHTVTTKDRFGLVTVNGELHQIVDIGMRMLAPRELYRAQGFPDDYIIDYVVIDGKIKPLTVTAQVRMCGNSVSPYAAAALVRANVYGNSAVTGGKLAAA